MKVPDLNLENLDELFSSLGSEDKLAKAKTLFLKRCQKICTGFMGEDADSPKSRRVRLLTGLMSGTLRVFTDLDFNKGQQ